MSGRRGASATKTLASQLDAMGIVHEAIEDGVGIGRISNEAMPLVDGDLAGEDRGAATIAFFENFVEVVAGVGVERLEPPIVQNQNCNTGEALENARIAPVAARECQINEQLWYPVIENRAVVTAGLVAEGAS